MNKHFNFGYNKCRITSRDPIVSTEGSAGIDFFVPYYMHTYAEDIINTGKNKENGIYFTPDLNSLTKEDVPFICVPPQTSVMIPSGIRTYFDTGAALLFVDKSGICTKKGLKIGACLIDSDYRGELMFHLINTTKQDQVIEFGEKIAQGVLIPYYTPWFKYIDGYEYDDIIKKEKEEGSNERGEGGFGSTGSK